MSQIILYGCVSSIKRSLFIIGYIYDEDEEGMVTSVSLFGYCLRHPSLRVVFLETVDFFSVSK